MAWDMHNGVSKIPNDDTADASLNDSAAHGLV